MQIISDVSFKIELSVFSVCCRTKDIIENIVNVKLWEMWVCVMKERQRDWYTQKALLYWLHWTGLVWTGSGGIGNPSDETGLLVWDRKMGFTGEEGTRRNRAGHSGMQPSLRQHKQHAVTQETLLSYHHHIAF